MFRFFVGALFVFLCVTATAQALTTTTTAPNDRFTVFRGLINTVRPCYPTGYVFTLSNSTSTLIFEAGKTLAIPRNVVPTAGQRIFAIGGIDTTCDIDPGPGTILQTGRSTPYFASSTPVASAPVTPTTTPPQQSGDSGSGGQPSSFLNQIQGVLGNLINSGTQIAGNALQNVLGGATGGVSAGAACYVINFGGPVVSPPIFCTSPPGAALIYIGPPVAKPIMCLQGPTCMETPNKYGPPLTPGQQALGCHAPAMVPCVVGNVVVGLGFPVVNVGTSMPGGEPPAPPETAPSSPNSCAANEGIDTTTAAGKAASERLTRDALKACGVTVNKGACPFGKSFRDVAGGCTDVGGLQCGTTSYACELAKKCGSFTVTGGNEAGHKTHSPGGALDVIGIDQCIKDNFKLIDADNCIYQDPASGTTFRDEGSCQLSNSTGPHFHICVGGKGCR